MSRRPHRCIPTLAWLVLLAMLLAGCAPYPRDPEHTTEQVSGSVLRVGVIHDPPFVDLRATGPSGQMQPRGREVRMARALAESMRARVQWVDGGAEGLFEDLEQFRLDVVIGGISTQSPWRQRVALSLPYAVRDRRGRLRQRVTALPPGENRWQMRVERFQRSPAARHILTGEVMTSTPTAGRHATTDRAPASPSPSSGPAP